MITDITDPRCDVEEIFRRFVNYCTNPWEPWFLDQNVSMFINDWHRGEGGSDTQNLIDVWHKAGLIEKRKPWHDERCWFLTQKGEEYWTGKKTKGRNNDS